MPSCCQCEAAGAMCYGKMHRPRCWRCSQQKIGCSLVEARKKGKGKEMEIIKVKWMGRKTEKTEDEKRTEVFEWIAGAMERIADGIEGLVEGQWELIEGQGELVVEQRLMGLGLEVLIWTMEEKEKGKGKEKAEKGVGMETDEEEEDEEEETDGEEDEARSAPVS